MFGFGNSLRIDGTDERSSGVNQPLTCALMWPGEREMEPEGEARRTKETWFTSWKGVVACYPALDTVLAGC